MNYIYRTSDTFGEYPFVNSIPNSNTPDLIIYCNEDGKTFIVSGQNVLEVDPENSPLGFIQTSNTSDLRLYRNSTTLSLPTLLYSYDLQTWTNAVKNSSYVSIPYNDHTVVYVKGVNNPTFGTSDLAYYTFSNFDACFGNISSLLYGDSFLESENLDCPDYCFYNMFVNRLADISLLRIVFNLVGAYSMAKMFLNNTKTKYPPFLSVKTLGEGCFLNMFADCTNLQYPVGLPCTELAPSCYESMFYYCSNLKASPNLPALKAEPKCYKSMFQYCRNLSYGGDVYLNSLAQDCCSSMFSNSGIGWFPFHNISEITDFPKNSFRYTCAYCSNLLISELKFPIFKVGPSGLYCAFCNIRGIANLSVAVSNDAVPDSAYLNNAFSCPIENLFYTAHEPNKMSYVFGLITGKLYLSLEVFNDTYFQNYTNKVCLDPLNSEDDGYLNTWTNEVAGNETSALVYYWIDSYSDGRVFEIGTVRSEEFPLNTSTTESVERTSVVTIKDFDPVTLTIVLGPFVIPTYSVNLQSQWRTSSKTNPDPTLYDGVYESYSNYQGSSGSRARMTIDLIGYKTFTIYIRSYAYAYNYTIARELDGDSEKSTTYYNQQSGTAILYYTKVQYDIDDPYRPHTILVDYYKGSSTTRNDDRGYLLIQKNE